MHRLLCGSSSQVQGFHKDEVLHKIGPEDLKIGALHPKLSPSLALESVVIVISTGLVGDYRTAGGSTPTTWSVTHAEALIERATFRHIRGGDAR